VTEAARDLDQLLVGEKAHWGGKPEQTADPAELDNVRHLISLVS
jgi:hypothetical protein